MNVCHYSLCTKIYAINFYVIKLQVTLLVINKSMHRHLPFIRSHKAKVQALKYP
jgi:hypothetical protein